MCLYSSVQNFVKKYILLGMILTNIYMSIDFVLDTQIENIGQNQPPN